jgi:hypothetical protein
VRRTVLLFALLAAACSDDDSAIPPTTSSSSTGGAGGQGPSCPPGEIPQLDGSCFVPGVPPSACPTGFEPVDAGCLPILPVDDCPSGQMALPGETVCRDVGADCGDPPWGNIPVESDTIYIDQSYTGMTSDGSAAMPYTRLVDLLSNGRPNALVAIAEGVYDQQLAFADQKLRVWGRCPQLVTISGFSNEPLVASVEIVDAGSDGSELHGVSVTGVGFGIAMAGVNDVLLENVWVHDMPSNGVVIDGRLGPVSATVRGALIERVGGIGVVAHGGTVHVEDTVIRDTTPFQGLAAGVIFLGNSTIASGSVRRSLLRRLSGAGIVLEDGEAEVEASAIIEVFPLTIQDVDGEGIVARNNRPELLALSVVGTTIVRTHQAGILFHGIDGRVDSSTIVEVQLTAQGGGVGIAVQRPSGGAGGKRVSIERSLIADSTGFGTLFADAEVSVSDVWVRDTVPPVDDFGDGIVVISVANGATVAVNRSLLERSARAGISNFSSTVTLGQSMFECNSIDLDGEISGFGDFSFDNTGGNTCGCGSEVAPECKVATTNLSAPNGL